AVADGETSPISEGALPELLSGSVQESSAGSGQSFNLSGVSVNTTYVVGVASEDEFDNRSVISNVLTVTTRPTSDFYEAYRGIGGGDNGGFGCAVAPNPARRPLQSGALLVVLGIALWGLRRRRPSGKPCPRDGRGIPTALAAASLLLLGSLVWMPTTVMAQDLGVDDDDPTGSLELRLGGYTPQVDDAFSGVGPYEQVFNNDSMLLAELEFGRYFGRLAGSWGGGFGFGFMQAVGKSIDDQGNTSVDTTVFNIIPMRLHAIYKFDLMARDYNIPFVPVVKLGADYYFWWITDGQGSIAQDESGGRGRGGTLGWHAAFALHILLDTLDNRAATNLQFDFGIYNTYLFAEYLIAEVDDFGSSSSIILSDRTFMFGLAFDY
ncbi:MAG: MXAN_2562 family outer membrane beta-barrel protein, partial [Myxococcota bacterium]